MNGTSPAINATNLNKIEDGVFNNDAAITSLDSDKPDKPSLLTNVTTWVDTDEVLIENGTGPKSMTVAYLKSLMGSFIIESGSNANGGYTKFSDGTLICSNAISSSSSANVTWTYPSAFFYAPMISLTAESPSIQVLSAQVYSRSATSCLIQAINTGNTRSACTVLAIAIGRWRA